MTFLTIMFLCIFSIIGFAIQLSCVRDSFSDSAIGIGKPRGIWINGTTHPPSHIFVADDGDNYLYHINYTGHNQSHPPGDCNLGTAGLTEPYGITSNGTGSDISDFWIIDRTDDFLYHLDNNCSHADATGNFSTADFGADAPSGVHTNASGIPPTDFWILDTGDKRIYHVNATGSLSADSIFNCSYSGFTNNSLYGLWSNATNSTPVVMYLPDPTDDVIWVINSTCHQIDYLRTDTWGSAEPFAAAGLINGGAAAHLYVTDDQDEKIYHFSEKIIFGNSSWTVTSENETARANYTGTITGTGTNTTDFCMPWITSTGGVRNCTYNVSGAVNVTVLNTSWGCEVNATFSSPSSVEVVVDRAVALQFHGVENIPAAISAVSILSIVIIYVVDVLRKREGYE